MASQTSYEVSNEELVNRVLKAAIEAGVSNSGLCIDPAAGHNRSNAVYLRGVLLARLDGVVPPYKPDDKVVVVDKSVVKAVNHKDPSVPPGTYTISRVWYRNGGWFLELKGISGGDEGSYYPLYPEKQFEPALGTFKVILR